MHTPISGHEYLGLLNELFIFFTVLVFRERLSLCVCAAFPFGF